MFLGLVLLGGLPLGGCATHWGKREPSDSEAELAAARSASRQGEWREAAGRWAEILHRGDERSREACIGLSRATLELGDAAGAQRFADLGLRTFSRDADLLVCRAEALVAQGFLHSAETAFEAALAAAPERPAIALGLARLSNDLGRSEAALAVLEPRLGTDGTGPGPLAKDPRAARIVADAQRRLGRIRDAFDSYARAFELAAPSSGDLVHAASMAEAEHVRAELPRAAFLAGGWLQRAAALDPQCTRAHYLLGVLAQGAEPAVAAAHLRRAVETDPADLDALTALAKLQARRGEIQDSIAMAERALTLETDPAKRTELERLAKPEPVPEAPSVESSPPSGGAPVRDP